MVPLAKNLGRTKKQKHNPALLRVREARVPGSTKILQTTETIVTVKVNLLFFTRSTPDGGADMWASKT